MQTLLVIPPVRNDSAGQGHFGAPRGDRTHDGVDRYVAPGSMIVAPENGFIGRYGWAYAGDPNWRIVDFHGHRSGLQYRFFYCVAVGHRYGDRVEAGQPIAMAQDVRERYPNAPDMLPHVHIELLDADGRQLNPEDYLQ